MVKLFFSGFPLDITEIELAKLIGPHGDISTIKIVRDKKTRICKGYAFIEMEDMTDAENTVIALDGVMMGDRELTVKINEDRPVTPPKRNFSAPRNTAYNKSYPPSNSERPKRPRNNS